jgi:glycosyltransferase involved in cell wall biosynthesis
MPHPIRILYAAGPGDVIGTYRHWAAGRDDPAQVAVTYSSQFYDFCRENTASGFVISSHPRREKVVEGNLRIEHRPVPFPRGPSLLYHFGKIWSGLKMVVTAVAFQADAVIVADGVHWFVLGLLPWFGIAVVPTLHCVLWPKTRPPTGLIDRFFWVLHRRFFRKRVTAVLSLSSDITQQLLPILRGKPLPIIPFLPSYRREAFGDGFGAPPRDGKFRVFFAGRIEKNKGVFDLLEIARRFAREGLTDIEFDLCGDGSQLETLRQAVLADGFSDRFRLHGHTARPRMMELYEQCHVVIVPTTSDFVEGFNKVVAEGVLAGRPVITSSVCPALEYVRDAVVEVPPDAWMGYADAIVELRNSTAFYDQKRTATRAVREQFCDPNRSWKHAVGTAMAVVRSDI